MTARRLSAPFRVSTPRSGRSGPERRQYPARHAGVAISGLEIRHRVQQL